LEFLIILSIGPQWTTHEDGPPKSSAIIHIHCQCQKFKQHICYIRKSNLSEKDRVSYNDLRSTEENVFLMEVFIWNLRQR